MTISEMIDGLQKVLNEHGDIRCYYATDEEGNEHHRVVYEPTILFKHTDEDDYYQDFYSQEDLDIMANEDDEFTPENYMAVCCIN